jgi:hypothetical protein
MKEHIRHHNRDCRDNRLQGMDRMQLSDGSLQTSRAENDRMHGMVMRRSKTFCQLLMVGGDGGG